jgi:hypothetical protein
MISPAKPNPISANVPGTGTVLICPWPGGFPTHPFGSRLQSGRCARAEVDTSNIMISTIFFIFGLKSCNHNKGLLAMGSTSMLGMNYAEIMPKIEIT